MRVNLNAPRYRRRSSATLGGAGGGAAPRRRSSLAYGFGEEAAKPADTVWGFEEDDVAGGGGGGGAAEAGARRVSLSVLVPVKGNLHES